MEINKIDTDQWYWMVLNGAGIKVDRATTELILQLFELVENKKGETDLKSIHDIKFMVNQMFNEVDDKGNVK